MVLPAVVEQQAKLGVSAEESKAQRIKRQQARFRDRAQLGRAFVPSASNPLVDILLARTVSGESPTKARSRDATAKRPPPSKVRQSSPTHEANAATAAKESRAIAGSSKSRPARKTKVVQPEAEPDLKPAPKRRSRPAQRKEKSYPDSDTDQPPPTTQGSGRTRGAASTSNGHSKVKPKSKAKSKAIAAKEVVEVLDTDDDQTLVEVPHKSKPKRNIPYVDDDETDDDAPVIRKRAGHYVDNSKVSGRKTATRVKTEKTADAGNSGKRISEDGEKTQNEKCLKSIGKKRPVSRNEEAVTAPPAKKGRPTNLMSTKPKTAIVPGPSPSPTRDFKNGENLEATGKEKGKGRSLPVERDNSERPIGRVSKPKKRKKEEDNCDDRPRKAVRFYEAGSSHSSSQKLKENRPDKKCERTAEFSTRDEPKVTITPSRAKTPKGPPREVLERIKASAARHLRCVDNEPDELDCLS